MRAQRVREGESRMEMQAAKWTAEGAVNSHYFESAQYSATWGIRQLPGICRYSAKRTVQTAVSYTHLPICEDMDDTDIDE